MQRHLGNIVPVDQDLSVGNVVEPGDQVDYRRFARTGRSHQSDALAGLYVEGNVL